jgi:hypothetical protein
MSQTQEKATGVPGLEELLDLPPQEVDIARIEQRTIQRIIHGTPAMSRAEEVAQGQAQGKHARHTRVSSDTERRAERRAQKRPFLRSRFSSRATRLLVAVAALLLVGVGSAFALNGILNYNYPGLDEPFNISRWAGSPSFYGQQTVNAEDCSVAVGETIDSAGVAVTLDAIATDGNIATVFLTYEFDEPVVLDEVVTENYDALDAVNVFTSQLRVSVNGIEIGSVSSSPGADDAKDAQAYFADDEQRVIKKASQYIIPMSLPNELEITVSVEPYTSSRVFVSAVFETLTFSPVTVDVSPFAAGIMSVEPGQYSFIVDGVTRTLDLEKLSVGPLGGVISLRPHAIDGERNIDYFDLHEFQILDQDGNALGVTAPARASEGELHAGYLRDIPENLTSISLVSPTSSARGEARSYAAGDVGAKIEIMPGGGFYLREYKVEGTTLTFVAEAYGVARERGFSGADAMKGYAVDEIDEGSDTRLSNPDFMLDEGSIAPKGRAEPTYDEETGIYTYTITFYEADEDLIRQIPGFKVSYNPGLIEYDHAQALSLPLRPAT